MINDDMVAEGGQMHHERLLRKVYTIESFIQISYVASMTPASTS